MENVLIIRRSPPIQAVINSVDHCWTMLSTNTVYENYARRTCGRTENRALLRKTRKRYSMKYRPNISSTEVKLDQLVVIIIRDYDLGQYTVTISEQ